MQKNENTYSCTRSAFQIETYGLGEDKLEYWRRANA